MLFSLFTALLLPVYAAPEWAPEKIYNCARTYAHLGESNAPPAPGTIVELKRGMKVKMKAALGDQAPMQEAYFLGSEVGERGIEIYVFFNLEEGALYRMHKQNFALGRTTAEESSKFIQIKNQVGDTCAANATTNCIMQLNKIPATERKQLLKTAIRHLYKKPESKLFYKGYEKTLAENHIPYSWAYSSDANGFQALVEHLKTGKPAVIDYAGKHVPAPATEFHLDVDLNELKIQKKMNKQMFVPVKDDAVKYSMQMGHAVMAVGTLEIKGEPVVLVLDSAGSRIRLWRESDFQAATFRQGYLLVGSRK